jgi:hypothetical protein
MSDRASRRRPERSGDREPERVRDMERLADLLPETARQFGLEEQLEQARLAAAWLSVVADRVPAAAGSCRLVAFSQDVATIEVDMAIVAQEIRLRSPELLAALRNSARVAVRQLRVVSRHV